MNSIGNSTAAPGAATSLCDRIERLSEELSEAMADWHDAYRVDHDFLACVVPSSKSRRPILMQNLRRMDAVLKDAAEGDRHE